MRTGSEFEVAGERMDAMRREVPYGVAARYEPQLGRVLVVLNNHLEVAIDPNQVQALQGKPADALQTIEISPSGSGLHFPVLDDDIYLPGLFQGIYGTAKRMRENGLGDSGLAA